MSQLISGCSGLTGTLQLSKVLNSIQYRLRSQWMDLFAVVERWEPAGALPENARQARLGARISLPPLSGFLYNFMHCHCF